jgi:hypothetical protein
MIEVRCKLNGFCGKCCYETEMPLTREDLERIKALGFDENDFSILVEGVWRLRNVDGKCYFLEENMCTIYEFRPEGCRIYPLVLSNGGVVVDDLCPRKEEVESNLTEELVKEAEKALEKIVKEVYS